MRSHLRCALLVTAPNPPLEHRIPASRISTSRILHATASTKSSTIRSAKEKVLQISPKHARTPTIIPIDAPRSMPVSRRGCDVVVLSVEGRGRLAVKLGFELVQASQLGALMHTLAHGAHCALKAIKPSVMGECLVAIECCSVEMTFRLVCQAREQYRCTKTSAFWA